MTDIQIKIQILADGPIRLIRIIISM